MNQCDFCGDDFDYPPNSTLEEHDMCVCENCEDAATEQLELTGEIEEESDFFDDID
jgi:hypothetical protein